MNTFKYRGWFIHETFMPLDQLSISHGAKLREHGRFSVSPPNGGFAGRCRSVHAAKCLITRLANKAH